MITRVLCIALMAASLGGCERAGIFRSDAPVFDGQRFRSQIKAERKDRQHFTVLVHQVSKSPEGAVAAGVYKATSHCITYFGTSDIDWTVGPDTQPLPVNGDVLAMTGTCRDL